MQRPEIVRRNEVEALCAAVVPGQGAIKIHGLSRGMVNESYRVTRDNRDYVLRVPIADGASIGLDRQWEARILLNAGKAALAPLLRSHDARGVLLSDWLVGRSWEGVDAAGIASIEHMVPLLKGVHALAMPEPVHRMNPRTWILHYESIIGCDESAHRLAANQCLDEWAALPLVPEVICHGDLHTLNLVQSGDALRLLDWEYAHVSEAFWDLAGWSANGDLDATARRHLLSCYLGRAPSAEQSRRLALLLWLYDYVCLRWSVLYLNRQPSGPAAAGVAERAALLDARLSIPAN